MEPLSRRGAGFDPSHPFADREALQLLLDRLEAIEYKLYGKIPIKFHRGQPTEYEFDLNLGVVHVTEQDCQRLSAILAEANRAWGTEMTYCLYPSREVAREIILNLRGSPLAPAEID
jgi:hypothetical protein